MKILVCVKQTIDPEAATAPDDDSDYYRLNPYDAYAMETALTLRAAAGGEVDVVSHGPARVARTIRRAWAMGADRGFHLRGDEAEAAVVAARLAAWARARSYDLVLAGAMSEDAMRGVTGPLLAEFLGLPYATNVVVVNFGGHDTASRPPTCQFVAVEREIEGGFHEALELLLPAALTIQTGTAPPRYPTLANLLRANQTPLMEIDAASLGFGGHDTASRPPKLQVVRVELPRPTRAGRLLEGSPAEKAEQLARLFRERGLLG